MMFGLGDNSYKERGNPFQADKINRGIDWVNAMRILTQGRGIKQLEGIGFR